MAQCFFFIKFQSTSTFAIRRSSNLQETVPMPKIVLYTWEYNIIFGTKN